MARIPYNEFKWTDDNGAVDYSTHKLMECPKHPESKYSTKGPGRNLHMIGAGLVKECPCPIRELVVITDGDSWTTTIKQDIGTYNLCHSGPAWDFAVTVFGWEIATFDSDAQEFADEYVAFLRSNPKYSDRPEVVDIKPV